MNHAKNFDTLRKRVENECLFESLDAEYSQFLETWVPQAGTPSEVGLSGKQSESFMGRDQESMTNLRAGKRCVVVGLIIEVAVRQGPDQVTAHLGACLRRSSKRTCFSSNKQSPSLSVRRTPTRRERVLRVPLPQTGRHQRDAQCMQQWRAPLRRLAHEAA